MITQYSEIIFAIQLWKSCLTHSSKTSKMFPLSFSSQTAIYVDLQLRCSVEVGLAQEKEVQNRTETQWWVSSDIPFIFPICPQNFFPGCIWMFFSQKPKQLQNDQQWAKAVRVSKAFLEQTFNSKKHFQTIGKGGHQKKMVFLRSGWP